MQSRDSGISRSLNLEIAESRDCESCHAHSLRTQRTQILRENRAAGLYLDFAMRTRVFRRISRSRNLEIARSRDRAILEVPESRDRWRFFARPVLPSLGSRFRPLFVWGFPFPAWGLRALRRRFSASFCRPSLLSFLLPGCPLPSLRAPWLPVLRHALAFSPLQFPFLPRGLIAGSRQGRAPAHEGWRAGCHGARYTPV